MESGAGQSALAQQIVARKLSVRETEREAQRLQQAMAPRTAVTVERSRDVELESLEDRLRQVLGTKVRISSGRRSGKIEIEYYSKDELNRLLEMFFSGLSR